MQKVGEITAVAGDQVEITFCRTQDCANCHACEGGQESTVIRLAAGGRVAHVGDLAAVELPTQTVIKASLLAYALPIAGLLGGMALGYALWPGNPGAAALTGLAGLGLCLGITWLTERFRRKSAAWQPRLVRILPAEVYAPKKENTANDGKE